MSDWEFSSLVLMCQDCISHACLMSIDWDVDNTLFFSLCYQCAWTYSTHTCSVTVSLVGGARLAPRLWLVLLSLSTLKSGRWREVDITAWTADVTNENRHDIPPASLFLLTEALSPLALQPGSSQLLRLPRGRLQPGAELRDKQTG